MAKRKLLVVDDDQWLLESLSVWLTEQGFEVQRARDCDSARAALLQKSFDACLIDVCLEGEDGFALLNWCQANKREEPIILMTGYGGPDTAVEALRAGAFDLLTKPMIDEELLATLKKALDQKSIENENARLKSELDRKAGMENILSHDPRMQRIFDVINSVADTKATILITGENGTGKSMIARAIHARSDRSKKPFVEVACGALPDNLLESELFGHRAGAFTGANTDKDGKFKYADSGSIFLDEIGTASQAFQLKLLRVLQEFQFEPIGSNQTVSVDTRCILATNENLEAAVQAGKFRQDLYYRINVIHLELPALRERVSDIPLLVDHFLQKAVMEVNKEIEGFAPETVEAMMGYNWPGNIRELENVIQRATLLTKEPVIQMDMLPPAILGNLSPGLRPSTFIKGQTLREALEEPERQIILEVLRANSFSRNLTADQLGINRTTLYKKMKKLGIDTANLQD